MTLLPGTSSLLSSPLFGVPVKAFGVAKRRLSSVLDPQTRSRLGMALAQRTVELLLETGYDVVVLAADEIVEGWANNLGFDSMRQKGSGLSAAATELVAASQSPWAIVFADLPLLDPSDVAAVTEGLKQGQVIAPARDGGTNVIAGHSADMRFSYGENSFHRHLALLSALGPTKVLTRTGLALDLDTPTDLKHAANSSDWVKSALRGRFS